MRREINAEMMRGMIRVITGTTTEPAETAELDAVPPGCGEEAAMTTIDNAVPTAFDSSKAESFAGRMLAMLNESALCLMLSVGHRTALLDALRDAPPASSAEIAARAGLHERYVREWLGAMVCAGVVDFDPQTSCFSLTSEHAAFLTRAAGSDNFAMFAQWISVFAGVEDDIVECFTKGGGVPYERYKRMHEVMREESALTVLSSLEHHVLPLVPGLADRLRAGIRVLDAGCGSGRAASHLAAAFPRSHFTGIDLSPTAIEFARHEAAAKGLANVTFVIGDLSEFDSTAPLEEFDLVTTFDAIHDQGQPLRVLAGIHKALRPDGVYLMQDIRASSNLHENAHDGNQPLATFLYTASCMHCMSVSLAQGGEGLGAMWGEQKAREYLQRAGFRSVETKTLAHDVQNNWYVVRK